MGGFVMILNKKALPLIPMVAIVIAIALFYVQHWSVPEVKAQREAVNAFKKNLDTFKVVAEELQKMRSEFTLSNRAGDTLFMDFDNGQEVDPTTIVNDNTHKKIQYAINNLGFHAIRKKGSSINFTKNSHPDPHITNGIMFSAEEIKPIQSKFYSISKIRDHWYYYAIGGISSGPWSDQEG
jgi:hypothetical protein